MNYSGLVKNDIANGRGVRVSLFVSGCSLHCKGCFNEEIWDFNSGKKFTEDTQNNIIAELQKKYYTGFSLLGGEPFDQDKKTLLNLILAIKSNTKIKDFWVWSGHNYEELISSPDSLLLLNEFDVLIDGKFEIGQKDASLAFRGSSNQRIIDLNKTREKGEIVLYDVNRV